MKIIEIFTIIPWLLFLFIFLFSLIKRIKSKNEIVVKDPNWNRFILYTVVSLPFAIILLKISSIYSLKFLSHNLQLIGIFLLWIGFAFFIWARITLGEFWTEGKGLIEGHKIIQKGPYSFVRHPIYSALYS